MSKSKRELSGEEKKLWRRVAAGVRTRAPLAPFVEDDEPDPPAPKRAVAKAGPPASELKPKLASQAPPANRGGEKRVRRGKLEIGGTIDLHGHTQASGRAALLRFLRASQARGDRTVIVVTGIGRSGEGVLKRRLPEWLAERDIRQLISGFAPAHRTHGGAGAFYVFIKRVVET
ncbi:MAG: Smr/MutS family protein [Caulobacterales bacterium]|nr:Smr/MutS family protein [Caulobacterales bacterium]